MEPGEEFSPGAHSAARAGFPLYQLNTTLAMPMHKVTPIRAGLQGYFKSILAQSRTSWAPKNSLQLSLAPERRPTGHSGSLCSFTLFARPQNPQAGIQLGEVKPRARILLRAVCKHLGFLDQRQIPFPILQFANGRQSCLFGDGRLPPNSKSAHYTQLIFGWLDIAKRT